MLDRQEHLRRHFAAGADTPEDSPRLFDVVHAAEALRPAFYCALRDTLFAADIETAARISSAGARRRRVATARGELFDTSGTMSGGGRAVRRSGMAGAAPATVEDDPRAARAELEQLAERYERLRSAETDLAGRLRALGDEAAQKRLAQQKLAIDAENDRQILGDLRAERAAATEKAQMSRAEAEGAIESLRAKRSRYEAHYYDAKVFIIFCFLNIFVCGEI